jgi:hypothetical protein
MDHIKILSVLVSKSGRMGKVSTCPSAGSWSITFVLAQELGWVQSSLDSLKKTNGNVYSGARLAIEAADDGSLSGGEKSLHSRALRRSYPW